MLATWLHVWLARHWADEALVRATDARRTGSEERRRALSARAIAADDAAFLARQALRTRRAAEARRLARRARIEALEVRRLCA